jgi:hypothetical protein
VILSCTSLFQQQQEKTTTLWPPTPPTTTTSPAPLSPVAKTTMWVGPASSMQSPVSRSPSSISSSKLESGKRANHEETASAAREKASTMHFCGSAHSSRHGSRMGAPASPYASHRAVALLVAEAYALFHLMANARKKKNRNSVGIYPI